MSKNTFIDCDNDAKLNLSVNSLNENYSKPIEIPIDVPNNKTITDPRTSIRFKKYTSFQVIEYDNQVTQQIDNNEKNKEQEPANLTNFDNKFLFDLIDSIKSIPCVVENNDETSSNNIMESLLAEVTKPKMSQEDFIRNESSSSASILQEICNKFKNVEDENSTTTCLKIKRNTKLEKILEKRNDYYLNEKKLTKKLNKSFDAANDDEKKNLVFSSLKSLMNYDFCKNTYSENSLSQNDSSKSLDKSSLENDKVSKLDESIDLYCDLDFNLVEENNIEEEKKDDVLIDNFVENSKSVDLSKSESIKKPDLNEVERNRSRKDDKRSHSIDKRDERSLSKQKKSDNHNKKYNDYDSSKYKENDYYSKKRSSSHSRSSSSHRNDYRKRKRSPIVNKRDKYSKY